MARRFYLTGQAPPGVRAEEKPGVVLTPSRKESPVWQGDTLVGTGGEMAGPESRHWNDLELSGKASCLQPVSPAS